MRILKYILKRGKTPICKLTMPKDAMILSVQLQGSNIVLWASVFNEREKKDRHFELLYTGETHDLAFRTFYGTIQVDDIVVHVFERLS